MSYYKNSYSAGDTFIDYSGNKYTVITGGNTPSTPFDSSNVVNDKIVWGDLELEPVVEGGGQGQDSYSIEEKLIGTWIDGKSLYRKVFRDVVDNTNSGFTSSTATIIKLYGCVVGNDGTFSMLPNSGTELYIVRSSGVIRTTTSLVLDYVVIEYTKN